jgi:pimeloyl-ACP methyl ester carboxylesterase
VACLVCCGIVRLAPGLRQEVVIVVRRQFARGASGRGLLWRRLGYCSALAGVVALVAAGCASTGGSSPGQRQSLPKTTLSDCKIDEWLPARCGYVWVPQDWAHPAGAKMRLRVVVLPARAASRPAAPLFHLAGFGQGATADLSWAAQNFEQLNQTIDLVFIDQRGTGGSWPQTCSGLTATSEPMVLRAAVSRCLASVNRDPRHDTTPAAVRDLDQARTALGYNQINLYGISYGVSLGLVYLQRYGAHVRTAVFDSGSLLDVPLWQLTPTSAQQAFDQMTRRCAADPACNRAYHPAADLATVVAALRAHPAPVTVTGPGGQQMTATIDLGGFLNAVIDDYLASSDTAVLLPADLHALARGQWAQVIRERGFASAASPTPAPDQLQKLTIECSDAWAAVDPAQIRGQAGTSVFAPATAARAAGQKALCAIWPHDAGVSGTVRSTAPILFLNGTADPADPPANVAVAPRTMPNAVLVSIPGAGHSVVATGCVLTETTAFVQAGVPANRANWAACTRALRGQLPAFPSAR